MKFPLLLLNKHRTSTFLITLALFCYPFAIYFGLAYFSVRSVSITIALFFFLRFILLKHSVEKHPKIILIFTTITIIGVSIIGVISNKALIIKLYPATMNLILLGLFSYSILYPPTIIERVAKLKTPHLSTEAIKYTRSVTIVWCIFFIANGLAALWTALFASMKIWTFYNGFFAYLLMGTLFVAEFAVRHSVKQRLHSNNKEK